MSDFKGIVISGEPVTTKHFVDAGIIKMPVDCPHPEEYIRPNEEGKQQCNLCGKVLI